MTAPANEFYWAWVDGTETTFNSSHYRLDERVISFEIDHTEGNLATLNVTVRNPHIGLLAPGRPVWAHFGWLSDGTVYHLFWGRLVGIPSDMFDNTITMQLIGKPSDFLFRKQRAAELLKVPPNYDPIFLDLSKRDDPDAILEAYSAVWHIDRLTHEVTASDVLIGEDGLEVFNYSDVPRSSVKPSLTKVPLEKVGVIATVPWTQADTSYVNIGTNTFTTYSGDGFVNEWPKPLAGIGDGWSVAYSNAVDAYGVANALTTNVAYNWQNSEKRHHDGDTLSISFNESKPLLSTPMYAGLVTSFIQNGVIDPFAVDSDGDPAPLNIPQQVNLTYSYVPLWRINTSLILRYDASRQRSERLHFILGANLQPVLSDPLVIQNTEQITISGADVSEPILNQLNWSAVAGTAVSLGQLIFPDDPTLPGQTSSQIATTAGTAGIIPPNFSDVAGATTVDGTVVWTSLGTAQPAAAAGDWTKATLTPLGAIILPRRPVFVEWAWLEQAGLQQLPQVGVSVSINQVVHASNGSFQICTLSGITGLTEPNFSTTWGVATTDGTVQWESLGTTLPIGSTYFICTQAGTTGSVLPPFTNTYGATTTDGSVVWTSIGEADVPIGGYPGHTPRSNYFPTDRGKQSIEYLLCLARAHLRFRSRVFKVDFTCRFERAINLSCRKNAIIFDPRLPGGYAEGKIVAYKMKGDGNRNSFIGHVTIECAVGTGEVVTLTAGTPTYAAPGYMAPGYQKYSGAIITPIVDELGYTPPVAGVVDDGLTFPLDRNQVVVVEQLHGGSSLAAQEAGIASAIASAKLAAIINSAPATSVPISVLQQQASLAASQNSVAFQLQQNPIWYELQLKPVTNGPFTAEYFLTTELLSIPKLVDLSGPSTL